jgi:hypothetical protein
MGAGWEREEDRDLREGREPVPDIGPDPDDVPAPSLPGWMLPVHAVAEIAGFGPRLDHAAGVVEEADDDPSLRHGGRRGNGIPPLGRRRGYPQFPVPP